MSSEFQQLTLVRPRPVATAEPARVRRQTNAMYTEQHSKELTAEQRARVSALAAARDVAHEAKGLFQAGLSDSYDLISLADWILNGSDADPVSPSAEIQATLDGFERDKDGDLVSPSGLVVPGRLSAVQEDPAPALPDPTPTEPPDGWYPEADDPWTDRSRAIVPGAWAEDEQDTAPEPTRQPTSLAEVEATEVPPRRVPGNPLPPVSPQLAETLARMKSGRRLQEQVVARLQEAPPEVVDKDPLVEALLTPPPTTGLEREQPMSRREARQQGLEPVSDERPSPLQNTNTGALMTSRGLPVRIAISGGYEVKEYGIWRPSRPDDLVV